MMLSETGLISILTIVSAIIGLSLRMCLRSKCDEVSCFCLKIHRNVQLESNSPQTNDLEMNNIYPNRGDSEKIVI
jgi:hypothetical protein